jgi:integrase
LRPTLPLRPTAGNLKHAARLREQIVQEIKTGTFLLAVHFPEYRFAKQHETPSDISKRTFAEWFEVWRKLAARDKEKSTMTIYARVVRAYWLPAFGGLLPAQITHEKVLTRLAELAAAGQSRKSQNNILIPMRKIWQLISTIPGAPRNPCDGIKNLKVQKPAPDPFTLDEVERVLAKFDNPVVHDYFEFSFFAGLRVSEQIALTWADVDLPAGTILVRRSKVEGETKERTKTNVERLVELNDRALAVLKRQKARTGLAGHEVFLNPITGRSIKLSGVRYRAPKEARDTSVTLALMAGANPVWVAQQHGHSVIMMMKSYAKWLPSADRGANRAAVNRSISAGEAGERSVK